MERSRPRKRPWYTGLLAFAPLLGCAPSEAPPVPADAGGARAPREVQVALAALVTWEHSLSLTGELAALELTTLSAKVPGRLEALRVDLGSAVAAGDEVARIEARDYALRVAQAEAAVAAARAALGISGAAEDDAVEPESTASVREARALFDAARIELERMKVLRSDSIASQAEFDTAEAAFRASEGRLQAALEAVAESRAVLAERQVELELASAALFDTVISAPFDGAVSARLASLGELLAEGDPIVRVVRLDPLRVLIDVPERSIGEVRAGQLVHVALEAGGPAENGRIARVGPALDAATRTLRVEAELANPEGRLRPGSFVRAEIVVDPDAQALAVPAQALVRFAGVDKLFVAADGVARERNVEVGRARDGEVEIRAGLAAGEQVVLAPGNLQGGDSLTVLP